MSKNELAEVNNIEKINGEGDLIDVYMNLETIDHIGSDKTLFITTVPAGSRVRINTGSLETYNSSGFIVEEQTQTDPSQLLLNLKV
jgi:hypothetical protein